MNLGWSEEAEARACEGIMPTSIERMNGARLRDETEIETDRELQDIRTKIDRDQGKSENGSCQGEDLEIVTRVPYSSN
ncbi:hypothetical protein L484_018007 [Morus notabilis]|uniref:Uncharacterized protein n=1 Tax=Morus notabilis TaxID=981085 RepID=W9RRN4_9ROSA|nr:hypothetical protein L484_018007 [Morus notabilis]